MIKIRVPATCANLGPGFDCLGLSLTLYNNYTFEKIESGLIIEGCPDEFNNENNLIYTSFRKALSIIGGELPGLKITVDAKIPVSRGMGSSAACIAAGVAAANEIADGNLKREDILSISSEIEGHPDNVTPAIFGGMTVSIVENKKVYYCPVNIPDNIDFYALVPDFKLSTELSRSVLPDTIKRADGVFNTGRAAFLAAVFNAGRVDLMAPAFSDKLHQQYRKHLINNFDYIVEKCIESGAITAFLSGAGPTIMSMAKCNNTDFKEKMEACLSDLSDKWTIIKLKADLNGYTIEKL